MTKCQQAKQWTAQEVEIEIGVVWKTDREQAVDNSDERERMLCGTVSGQGRKYWRLLMTLLHAAQYMHALW
eukprot:CAMPEP_0174369886 /NCGR_PEP_ID=MMETSP0811_2-20130205/94167_1 /TAXON_ID=73025 ORGANISM="Eutreptiella gymnastica-like, Strain CCMP1594" /NCGR_SAMPLE_ID=MMETSP0811_2 /ASSEMBLY_ACC=CAM_ASM_000667 /LENGTH=70 /DNA_ID=CAMNT_0015514789 /DNA_START=87 /DNA_END=296 /DNA_ORIENTATION=+